MDPNPSCPICVGNDWDVIGERLYAKNDVAHLNTYAKIRYEVLFEIWFPTADEVIVYSILCEHCGFVGYRPRPTEADIQGKYRYLTSHEIARNEYSGAQKVDTRRSKELFKFVLRYLDSAGRAKILDFGGGNGRLMSSFLRAGFACGVVDFVEETIPGVDFAGHSLADIPRGDKFDVIICSHVLEHLADPLNTVKALAGFLEPTGILYVEVPSEIWRRPPLAVEPVTHINFFTVASLRCLLAFAGLGVQVCKHDSYLS